MPTTPGTESLLCPTRGPARGLAAPRVFAAAACYPCRWHARLYPTLTVVDAVRVLTATGPASGDLNDGEGVDTAPASAGIPCVRAGYGSGLGAVGPDTVDVRAVRA